MRTAAAPQKIVSKEAQKARRKFVRFFPRGFADEKYASWERGYKWQAHERWVELLSRPVFRDLLAARQYTEIAARAFKTLSGTNLLFSFESMALRDALKSPAGARRFAEGLYEFIYGRGAISRKFDEWCEVVASLPKKQSRVLTHPVVTVFGFLAQPEIHFFFKPTVTRTAAERYGHELQYTSKPSWETYRGVLDFATAVKSDLADLKPKDMIDVQSFIWVIGSAEYE